MTKSEKCANCIHDAVCEKLEEVRDPLGWINTEGEFVCSYSDTAFDVALELIEYLEDKGLLNMEPWAIAELKKKYKEKGNEVSI